MPLNIQVSVSIEEEEEGSLSMLTTLWTPPEACLKIWTWLKTWILILLPIGWSPMGKFLTRMVWNASYSSITSGTPIREYIIILVSEMIKKKYLINCHLNGIEDMFKAASP